MSDHYRTCDRCGLERDVKDMATMTTWDLSETRYYCHPAWAVGATCYMLMQPAGPGARR